MKGKEILLLAATILEIINDIHYGKIGSADFIGEYSPYEKKIRACIDSDKKLCQLMQEFNNDNYPSTLGDIRMDNIIKYLSEGLKKMIEDKSHD